MLKPIRIGDLFQRTVRRKNPDGSAMDLSGLTHTFKIRIKDTIHSFAEGDGLTVTAATGVIDIELTSLQTAEFEPDYHARSYFEVNDGTDVYTRCRLAERVLTREDIVNE